MMSGADVEFGTMPRADDMSVARVILPALQAAFAVDHVHDPAKDAPLTDRSALMRADVAPDTQIVPDAEHANFLAINNKNPLFVRGEVGFVSDEEFRHPYPVSIMLRDQNSAR